MKDLKLGGIGVFFIYLFHSVVVLWGTESDLVLSFVELIPVVSGESKLIFSLGAHSLKLPVTICVYMKLGSVTHYFFKNIMGAYAHPLSLLASPLLVVPSCKNVST